MSPSELERKRLKAKGWSSKSVADFEKFGHSGALFYSLIGVAGGVVTPRGQGTLINVQCGEARVQLLRGKTVRLGDSKKRVKPTRNFTIEDVKPINNIRRSA